MDRQLLFGGMDKLSKIVREPRGPVLRHCESSLALRNASPVTVSFFHSLDHLKIGVMRLKV